MLQEIVSPRGLVRSQYYRYYRQFNEYLDHNYLLKDLNQTIELISLEIKGMELRKAGEKIDKGIRSFLKDIGFRKQDGKFIIRDYLFSEQWWHTLLDKGIPPKNG